MILALHSDGSYNSEPGSKSRAGGHYYLADKDNYQLTNGAVLTLTKIIKFVMSSASEVEVASLFYNCKAAIPLRIALEEMGHPQPATPVITDNTTAEGLIKKTMIPKRSKAYDMRFNWLKCRKAQRQFNLIWRPGTDNKADYHTKTHPVRHYVNKRKEYVLNWIGTAQLLACKGVLDYWPIRAYLNTMDVHGDRNLSCSGIHRSISNNQFAQATVAVPNLRR